MAHRNNRIQAASEQLNHKRASLRRTMTMVTGMLLLLTVLSIRASERNKPDPASIYGRIKIVDSFPDFKVKAVNSFPDVKVKIVKSFPGPGKWQIVDSFPDYKIKLVNSFPDFTVEFENGIPSPK